MEEGGCTPHVGSEGVYQEVLGPMSDGSGPMSDGLSQKGLTDEKRLVLM
jgi:hypothetical protein